MHAPALAERLCVAALAAAMLSAPGKARAQGSLLRNTTADAQRPFAEFSSSALAARDSLVALARAQIGKKYRLGGTSPERGFDCSGLIKYVLSSLRLEVPRTSREQSRIGVAVPRDPAQLRPGDVLLFGKPKAGVSHVGIYVGGGRYIHASSTAGRVIESPLDRPPSPLVKPLKSARRVLIGSDTAVVATIAAKLQ
jgi:cell wall-associated NlpC family hydrolase